MGYKAFLTSFFTGVENSLFKTAFNGEVLVLFSLGGLRRQGL